MAHARVRAPRYVSVFPKASWQCSRSKPRTNSKEAADDCYCRIASRSSFSAITVRGPVFKRRSTTQKKRFVWIDFHIGHVAGKRDDCFGAFDPDSATLGSLRGGGLDNQRKLENRRFLMNRYRSTGDLSR